MTTQQSPYRLRAGNGLSVFNEIKSKAGALENQRLTRAVKVQEPAFNLTESQSARSGNCFTHRLGFIERASLRRPGASGPVLLEAHPASIESLRLWLHERCIWVQR